MKQQYPTDEDLQTIKFIVLGGSASAAYNDKVEWISAL